MAENAESTRGRDRSPSYPLIPLEAALERLTAFEAHFKRSAARPEKVGDAWGIKAKAYAGRTQAALRYFGLVEYQGVGKELQVVISDEGRKYLRAQQEETRREVLRAAALRPKQIAKFWGEWGEDRPEDTACLDELMFQNGFSEAGAREFLKVYDATISFAGLSGSDKIHPKDDGDEDGADDSPDGDQNKAAIGDLVQWTSGGALQFAQAKRVRAVSEDEQWVFVEGSEMGIPMEQVIVDQKTKEAEDSGAGLIMPPRLPEDPVLPTASVRKEVTSLDEGDAVLVWPESISPDSYHDLEAWLNSILHKARRRAGVPEKGKKPVQ